LNTGISWEWQSWAALERKRTAYKKKTSFFITSKIVFEIEGNLATLGEGRLDKKALAQSKETG